MVGVVDIIRKIAGVLPEIKNPERPPLAKERIVWTGIALLIFFIMYQVSCLGAMAPSSGSTDFLQTITASNVGSLLTTGIGPIVLASIFLQLFVGAGLLKLNLKVKEDKQKFHEMQKVLAIALAIAEGAIFVISARLLLIPLFPGLGESYLLLENGTMAQFATAGTAPITAALVILQIALGSIFLMYLDEIVSKYGIGSGISLFIAAGVSLAIIGGTVALFVQSNGVLERLTTGGAEAIPNALKALLPLGFTALVFLIVAYAEGMKVEIPVAFEKVRGLVPKLPLKFFYVSNIPVIFASALIMSIQLFSTGLGSIDNNFVHMIGYTDSSGRLVDGFLYLLTPIYVTGGTEGHFNYIMNAETPIYHIPEWVHAIVYILALSCIAVMFGLFWVETSGMDPKSMAEQLTGSGMQIPGFRRDPRMLELILSKHIIPLTIVGSFCVGMLTGLADLTGALGTGTGILLTVGILYKMYEQMEQMNILEAYPGINSMLGGGK